MAVFSEVIARREPMARIQKRQTKQSSQDAKHNYPNYHNICKDRFKCADFMRTQPIAKSDSAFHTYDNGQRGKTAFAGLLKQKVADAFCKASKMIYRKK